ncbi:RNA recognition motif containing protein [Nitzschia inconspicua]|uniref:RNA recognition motif containing protein n=1 Tax=Nitzschia inconspicua TaxID=303405 RepID=A0A9K3KP94_9STRA|nr:RNA recognition motif containing protein [Nitzschia inconspicua]
MNYMSCVNDITLCAAGLRRSLPCHPVVTLHRNSLIIVAFLYFISMAPQSEAWIVSRDFDLHSVMRTTVFMQHVSKAQSTTSLCSAAQEQQQFQQQPRRRFSQALNNNSSSAPKYGADSKLMSIHKERIKTAGRKGTKRFVDPCKVFVGNLPFDVDSEHLANFILDTMGQTRMNLHACKVITDWKTGKSKGYGFVEFTDPIFATVCMDVCHGKTLNGRPVTVSQGKKKDQDQQLYIKKKRTDPESEEEKAISAALDEAESDDDNEEYEAEDLDVDEDGIAVFGDNNDEDLELDAVLFGLAGDDDDDDGVDGIFLERKPIYEEMDPNLNREQRREAAKRLKRKKLPHKGFG